MELKGKKVIKCGLDHCTSIGFIDVFESRFTNESVVDETRVCVHVCQPDIYN